MVDSALFVKSYSVPAILRGEETRTCRFVNSVNKPHEEGDILWLSSEWATHKISNSMKIQDAIEYWNYIPPLWIKGLHGDEETPGRGKWRRPRHMPKVFAHIFCKVLDVRTMNVQDISALEAEETIAKYLVDRWGNGDIRRAILSLSSQWNDKKTDWQFHTARRLKREKELTYRSFYSALWDKFFFGRRRGWDTNPPVWNIRFKLDKFIEPEQADLQPFEWPVELDH